MDRSGGSDQWHLWTLSSITSPSKSWKRKKKEKDVKSKFARRGANILYALGWTWAKEREKQEEREIEVVKRERERESQGVRVWIPFPFNCINRDLGDVIDNMPSWVLADGQNKFIEPSVWIRLSATPLNTKWMVTDLSCEMYIYSARHLFRDKWNVHAQTEGNRWWNSDGQTLHVPSSSPSVSVRKGMCRCCNWICKSQISCLVLKSWQHDKGWRV